MEVGTKMLYILKREYKTLEKLLFKLQMIMNKNELILLFSKTQQMKNIHNITKKLNDDYNRNVKEICVSTNDLNNSININNIDEMILNEQSIIELIYDFKTLPISVCPKHLLVFVNYEPFKEVKHNIDELCFTIGYGSINNVLYLTNNSVIIDEQIMEFLNNIFNPISYKIENNNYGNKHRNKINNNDNNKHCDKINNNDNNNYTITKIPMVSNKHIILFNNQCIIQLTTKKGIIKITGYIENDPLNINIRTSQISNTLLYEKRQLFLSIIKPFKYNSNLSKSSSSESLLEYENSPKRKDSDSSLLTSRSQTNNNNPLSTNNNNPLTTNNNNPLTTNNNNPLTTNNNNNNPLTNNIDKSFAEKYVENMNLTDILLLDNQTFLYKLTDDYNKFIEITNMSFIKLIKYFTKNADENLNVMFNTIKLLLLGDEKNTSMASLLFNLLKDKKTSETSNNSDSFAKCSNDFVSSIIYEQLNFTLQNKLKKSEFNITAELDKLKDITFTDVDTKKQILLSTNMPNNIKKICLDKLEELKSQSSDYNKIKLYINTLINFPWPTEYDDIKFKLLNNGDISKSSEFLKQIKLNLDKNIYGHAKTKTKILHILSKLITGNSSSIQSIALVGEMGVGKSKMCQILAKSLDIPFVQITLGGQNDGELLHGHGYTYAGSQPGMIVKKMIEAGSSRCIFYFDELDKCVSRSGQVNELMSILIHLTDPMTNNAFQDRFFQEITFPLNKVIFVFSFNDIDKVDKILLDRLEVIKVSNYSTKDKIQIAREHLIKDCENEFGFTKNGYSLKFSDDIIKFIIENYTVEAGVRSLKKKLANIYEKINCDLLMGFISFNNNNNFCGNIVDNTCNFNNNSCGKIVDNTCNFNSLIVTKELVISILGVINIEVTKIHTVDSIGIINGLYASSNGGGIVPIQICKSYCGNKDKFITVTGNAEKIMSESVEYSFKTAMNLISDNDRILFNKHFNNSNNNVLANNSNNNDVLANNNSNNEVIANNNSNNNDVLANNNSNNNDVIANNNSNNNDVLANNSNSNNNMLATGLHVHVLDPSTPKDGPSAGCAFCIAFLSVILNKKIKHDYAITGEVDLFGKIGKIGGLKDKISGAFRANVKTILIPLSNKNDVEEIQQDNPEYFSSNTNIIYVETVQDAIKHIFV